MFELKFTVPGREDFKRIKQDPSRAGLLKQLRKVFGYLQANPRHPSLRTHEFSGVPNPFEKNGKVFEAYAQNQTPAAYRVFWCYGPDKNQITIIAITPHP